MNSAKLMGNIKKCSWYKVYIWPWKRGVNFVILTKSHNLVESCYIWCAPFSHCIFLYRKYCRGNIERRLLENYIISIHYYYFLKRVVLRSIKTRKSLKKIKPQVFPIPLFVDFDHRVVNNVYRWQRKMTKL